ncbi:MAG TPA: hypothetical protein VFR06_00195 [Gallionellaceae bacterium]|nr:hypothetical protein [Gallionellaceae bacterium]
MKKHILLGAILSAFPLAAMAGSSASVDIDLHASSIGHGIAFAIPLSENVAGRISLSKLNYSFTTTQDQINYDATFKLGSVAALADWHVFGGFTHLTAGIIFNNNDFTMQATPVSGNFTIDGVTYNTTDVSSLNATVTFNKVAPYLGLGWSGRASKTGFSFKSDIGVMFIGSPKSELSITGAQASNPTVLSHVANAQAQLDQDLSKIKLYPVISLGIGYAF